MNRTPSDKQRDPSGQLFEALLRLGLQFSDLDEFNAAALGLLLESLPIDHAALLRARTGHWQRVAEAGVSASPPIALLAEALDREKIGTNGAWLAAPLDAANGRNELLVVQSSPARQVPGALREAIESIMPALGQAINSVREVSRQRRRLDRLQTLLDITAQWNRTHEMEPLLVQIAQAACQLLAADRASIFLWDRRRKQLVGRPALGVRDNELRIADDTGIVGQVLRSGEARRVDRADQDEIDHKVDALLGYQTRNLVCVPLRGRNGELFGAFEAINKLEGNFTEDDEAALEELAAHAAVALENTQERESLLHSQRQMTEQAAQGIQLIGTSPAMEALRSTVQRVAATDLAILIFGENGTGKEVVSRSVHYLSDRRDQPFIAVNCAALTETLLESELFGHEKGAFTDAHEARVGKFELAAGGTLFLDEIGDLSLGGQSKLLRVLEEKVVVRVGGSKTIHTDARVIAATNQNLAEMVRDKRFRQDLYFRLNVVTLNLPPLRERGDDVLLLAEHFLSDFSRQARRQPPVLTAAVKRRLVSHNWPGNVRELRNLMERLAYLCPDDRIEADDLAFILHAGADASAAIADDQPLADATNQFQSSYIHRAIERAGGNMSEAAKHLGLHRSNLYRKMRQLGMNLNE